MGIRRIQIANAFKVLIAGAITGFLVGFSFNVISGLFSLDSILDLIEFLLSLIASMTIPVFIIIMASRAQTFNFIQFKCVAVIVPFVFGCPVLGASFGASGSEPIWMFGMLGFVGGIIWSSPLAIWTLFSKSAGD